MYLHILNQPANIGHDRNDVAIQPGALADRGEAVPRKYDGTERDYTNAYESGDAPVSLGDDLELVEQTLWVGTSNGAYRLKLESGKLQKFQDPDLVTIGNVYDIERHEDQLWFATDVSLLKLNLKTGDRVEFVVEEDGRVVLVPTTIHVSELRGIMPRPTKIASLDEMDAAIEAGAGERFNGAK